MTVEGTNICRARRIRSFLFRVEKEEKKNEEREKEMGRKLLKVFVTLLLVFKFLIL